MLLLSLLFPIPDMFSPAVFVGCAQILYACTRVVLLLLCAVRYVAGYAEFLVRAAAFGFRLCCWLCLISWLLGRLGFSGRVLAWKLEFGHCGGLG